MRNKDLAFDYIKRSRIRLKSVQVLFDEESWADVVREAQEIVELSLKGLLRHHGIEFPRIHDISKIMEAHSQKLPESIRGKLGKLAKISKTMRRDRELAFYGSEDLTPSEFYEKEDAQEAFDNARFVVDAVEPTIIESK